MPNDFGFDPLQRRDLPGQPQSPGDMQLGATQQFQQQFQQEVFAPLGPTDYVRVFDAPAQRRPDVEQGVQAIFANLQRAQQLLETQGIRAAQPAYAAAIQAASSLNPQALEQHRNWVQQQLQNPQLDQQTRMTLTEQAMLLAPCNAQGAPRLLEVPMSNFWLALVRAGFENDPQAQQLIAQARQLNPRLAEDPNFQRHYTSATQAGTPYARAGQRYEGPIGQQPSRGGQPTPFRPQQPQPVQYRPQQPGGQPFQPVQPGGQPFQPVQPGGQPFQPVQPGGLPFQPPGQPTGFGELPAQPFQPVQPGQPLQPGMQPGGQPLGDRGLGQPAPPTQPSALEQGIQGATPLEQAQAVAPRDRAIQLTPQLRALFDRLIRNAEAGVSPRLAAYQQADTQAANALRPLLQARATDAAGQPLVITGSDGQPVRRQDGQPLTRADAIRAYDDQVERLLIGLAQPQPPAQPLLTRDQVGAIADMWEQLEKTTSAQERQQLQQRILQAVPESARNGLQQIMANRDAVLGPQFLANMYQYNRVHSQFMDEQYQAAALRIRYAELLTAANDMPAAQQQLLLAAQRAGETGLRLAPRTNDPQRPFGVVAHNPDILLRLERAAQACNLQPNQLLQALQGRPAEVQPPVVQPGGVQPGGDRLPAGPLGAQPGGDQAPPSLILLRTTKQNFDRATDSRLVPQPDLPAVLRQYAGEFQRAITLADQEYTALTTRIGTPEQLQQRRQQALTALETASRGTDQAATRARADMQLFNDIFNGATPQIRQQALQQFSQNQPQIAEIIRNQALVINAQEQQFLCRFVYANASLRGNDRDGARRLLIEGFQRLPEASRAMAGMDQDINGFMLQVGATPRDCGIPDSPAPAGQPQAAQLRDRDGRPLTGLAADFNTQTLIDLASNRFREGLRNAQAHMEAAVTRSEAETNVPQLTERVERLVTELERGRRRDPNSGLERDMTPAERMMHHMQIIGMIQQMRAPFDAHSNYALMAKSAGQHTLAWNEYQAAIRAIDQLPSALIRRAVALLGRDSANNSAIPEAVNMPGGQTFTRADLHRGAQALEAVRQMPITIRETAIRFCIAGGAHPTGEGRPGDPNSIAVGAPIGDMVIESFNENGLPQVRRATAGFVNRYTDAARLIEECVAKHQQINDVNVVQNPGHDQQLNILRDLTLANCGDELRRRLQNSRGYWDNTVSTIVGTVAGLALAGGILWLTRRPQAAEAGLGLIAGSSYGGRLAALGLGFGGATAANYAMMRGVYGHNDYTLWDAGLRGGGGFLATTALVGLVHGVGALRGAAFTAERSGELGLNAMQMAVRNGQIANVAGQPLMLIGEGAAAQPTLNALARAYEMQRLVPPQALRAAIAAGEGETALTAASFSRFAATGSGYYNMHMLTTLFPWARGAQIAGATGEAAAIATEAAPAIAGEAGTVATATAPARHWSMRLMSRINPYQAVEANTILTEGSLRGSRILAGFTGMMGYNTLDTLGTSTSDWLHGANDERGQPITPWGALYGRIATADPFRNMILNSLLIGTFAGGVHIGARPAYVSPVGAFRQAEGLGGRLFSPLTSQVTYPFRIGGAYLNPGVMAGATTQTGLRAGLGATRQFITSGLFNQGNLWNRAGQLYQGHVLRQTGLGFRDALDRLDQPLTDDPNNPLLGRGGADRPVPPPQPQPPVPPPQPGRDQPAPPPQPQPQPGGLGGSEFFDPLADPNLPR